MLINTDENHAHRTRVHEEGNSCLPVNGFCVTLNLFSLRVVLLVCEFGGVRKTNFLNHKKTKQIYMEKNNLPQN